MKPNFNPKQGDPVRIRLLDGRAVWANYDESTWVQKEHYVEYNGKIYRATRRRPCFMECNPIERVRFIYPLECMNQ